jgi:hypothetical protein
VAWGGRHVGEAWVGGRRGGEAGVGGREAMRKEGGHIWVGGISP